MSTPQRTPEQIRASIEANRNELATSLATLRSEVAELTDWRKQLAAHQREVMIAAGVAGFVVAGGIAGIGAVLTRRSRRKRGR